MGQRLRELEICSNCKHIKAKLNVESMNEPAYYFQYCDLYGEDIKLTIGRLCEGDKFEKKE